MTLHPPLIAAYQGISWQSKVIRWYTRSVYSHVAWVDTNGETYEAWEGRVRLAASLFELHTPGTVVDLFEVNGIFADRLRTVRAFHAAQVGKKYDWLGILRMVSRRPFSTDDQAKWFCSELVHAAHAAAGLCLQVMPPWKVTPDILCASPLLDRVGQVVVGRDEGAFVGRYFGRETARPENAQNGPATASAEKPALSPAKNPITKMQRDSGEMQWHPALCPT